jgi:hypothetical protein
LDRGPVFGISLTIRGGERTKGDLLDSLFAVDQDGFCVARVAVLYDGAVVLRAKLLLEVLAR